MTDKVVKLGVIGLGKGAYTAAEMVGEKSIKISAICDWNPKKIVEALERHKGKFDDAQICHDIDELLKTDIDAIYIATDAVCHVPYVIKSLEAGKHVLSEIPAVNSIEEARQLKAAVKAHPHLKYMTGENCCYWAFIQAWKKMYEEGKFGEAIYVEGEYIHSKDYREFKQEDFPPEHWRSYNPAIKYITHQLGPILQILDDRCVSVSCMVPDIVYNPYTKRVNNNGVAIFKTAKGAVIRIFICFDAYAGFDHNFALYGTKGTIETDKTKPLEEAHSFARFSDIPGTIEEKVEIPVTLKFPGEADDGGHGGADKKMMLDFVKCIIEDTEPPIDVDLGIQMTIPGIIAAESSDLGGALLEIPEI